MGALWALIKIAIFYFFRGSKTPSKPPKTPANAGGVGGGSPPARGVWGAGAPQGAQDNIKYRPKASYVEAALCRGGIENRELALELVYGADFWCNRHCRTSPVVLEGFWGQVWPKIGRKPAQ